MKRLLLGFALIAAAPALARDLTPHSAAALLDETFPTSGACQRALESARSHHTAGRTVNGLSYASLFAQGRCRALDKQGAHGWRIRMHWRARQTHPHALTHAGERYQLRRSQPAG